MSKIHYFGNKFSKIAKRSLNLRFWWPELVWFGQIVFFKLIMTKSVMTSCHRNYVTEKRHQTKVIRFFNFGHFQIKIFSLKSRKCIAWMDWLVFKNDLIFSFCNKESYCKLSSIATLLVFANFFGFTISYCSFIIRNRATRQIKIQNPTDNLTRFQDYHGYLIQIESCNNTLWDHERLPNKWSNQFILVVNIRGIKP